MSSRSQNGKNTSNLRKIQLEWSTTRRKAIYPIKKKKPLNYLALLGALLCHCVIAPALQAAGSKRSLVTPPPPPPPPPRRDPCSRTAGDLKSRFQSSAEAGLPPRILGYLTKLATDKAQPTSRPAATSRAKIGFSFSGGGITNPATSGSSQNRTTRESPPAGSAAAAALPATLVLSL